MRNLICSAILAIASIGCGSSTTTDNATQTSTATSTTTDTNSTTPPATGGTGGNNTATTTSTNTAVSPLPEWCNAYAGPGGVTGLPLDGSEVSNGSWHVANTMGEWIANCKVDAVGNAVCCGTLATEANNASSPSLTTWTGMATEKCVFWTPNNTKAPTISGTGYTVSGTRLNLTNSSPAAWLGDTIQIAGCPGFPR